MLRKYYVKLQPINQSAIKGAIYLYYLAIFKYFTSKHIVEKKVKLSSGYSYIIFLQFCAIGTSKIIDIKDTFPRISFLH